MKLLFIFNSTVIYNIILYLNVILMLRFKIQQILLLHSHLTALVLNRIRIPIKTMMFHWEVTYEPSSTTLFMNIILTEGCKTFLRAHLRLLKRPNIHLYSIFRWVYYLKNTFIKSEERLLTIYVQYIYSQVKIVYDMHMKRRVSLPRALASLRRT